MIWYHLYEKGEGLRVGFLCVANTFDGASDAADSLVADGSVSSSVWILNEKDLQDLHDSIAKEVKSSPRPIVIGNEYYFEYPAKNYPRRYCGHAEHSGHHVRVLREWGGLVPSYNVVAEDGWEGQAYAPELKPCPTKKP